MKIYDSRLKETVEFEPLEEGKVKMYVCGPTVYDKAHLGHGRSAVSFDVVRRYFEYKYGEENVIFVSNYTDIDDKMINRAKEEGISVEELADKVIPIYERDYEALGVKKPNFQPKATKHVKEIIELIKDLEKGGFTYVLEDGVYYDVSKFPDYGKLSGQKLEDLKMGARIDVNDKKKNPYDFVLWKFKKEGEPAWESPWGEGRPGWHIECSAMTWKVFGEKFDIHGGGLDLKFPHHECEIAQSCGAFGKDSFAKYWMHNGFIQVNNEKMSKSLGNFFTLEDIFAKYDPQVVRFMFLQTHYRNPINFSDQLLEQAKAGLERIHGFVRRLEDYNSVSEMDPLRIEFGNEVNKSMDNDFDTSGALGTIFTVMNSINPLLDDRSVNFDKEFVLDQLKRLDNFFGFIYPREKFEISDDIESLISQREEARESKDFKKSDEIRDELLKRGIVLEDTANGTIWKKA
ncbi:MAG: cysteine--tRNA ligase [Candidatus Gracilibacteria bacterium]|nr:cysteine--tRNA ligase [Candidatus Gracilibacteria bacterium]